MAGVASSTISRVLNNNPGVSENTRTRIKQLMEKTGFTPSAKARFFYQGHAGAIGLLIPRPNEYIFSNPFYLDAMHGAADAADLAKMNLLLVTTDKDSYTYLYKEQRVDGLILMSAREDDLGIIKLMSDGYPFILIGRYRHSVPLNSIEIDNVTAAREATEYLISLGHRHIAHLGGATTFSSGRDRSEGYRQALSHQGIPYDDAAISMDDLPSPATGAARVREILSNRPETTAFFAFNDLVAIGAMDSLRELGYQPGVNISVLGFDDIFAAKFTNPPLTTVRQSGYEKGRLAVERLRQILAGDQEVRTVVVQTQLILRQSCHKP